MSLKSLFGLEEKHDDEPCMDDGDQILAYLEDQQSPSSPPAMLEVFGGKGEPFSVRVDGVFEKKKTMGLVFNHRLSDNVTSKIPFVLYFITAGVRLRTEPIFFQRRFRDNHIIFSLPKKVYMAERRAGGRVVVPMRERGQVILLENFTQGIGAVGKLMNVNARGFGVKIDKAMKIKGQQAIAVHKGLYSPGQALMMVRIKNLSALPTLEFTGVVSHLSYVNAAYLMGVRVTPTEQVHAMALDKYLANKPITNPDDFPLIPRLKKRDPKEAPKKGVSASSPAAADLGSVNRVAVVCVPGSKTRMILSKALQDSGFTRVIEIETLAQLAGAAAGCELAAMALFHRAAEPEQLEVVKRLMDLPALKGVPVMMLVDHIDIRTKIAMKSHGIQHILDANDSGLLLNAKKVAAQF